MILSISDKKSLRKTFLQQRSSLEQEDWQTRSQGIVARLKSCPWVQQADHILAYFSIRQEPDLRSLFTLDKTWGFPVIQGQDLLWFPWKLGEPLELGTYGIPTPSLQEHPLPLQSVDLILVPALALDRLGYRLGYGGGFYDRLLARSEAQVIPTIGVVFDFALVPQLPRDDWDRPLRGWCTEHSTSWNGED
ncbi:MAG: 5-formyltetrahydrofolate cyclo-ligase [Prochlorotrichaceae cyanobacterium]